MLREMVRMLPRLEDADLNLDPSGLARLVAIDLYNSKDVVLLVSPSFGRAVLDDIVSRLGGGRDRLVRISAVAEGGLSLSRFLGQLATYGKRLSAVSGDAGAERDIRVLTTLDPSCDRIILLVDSADQLDRGTLQAIQLASAATVRLHLVFAGGAQLFTTLDHAEHSELHGRLLRGVRYAAMDDMPVGSGSEPASIETTLAARPRRAGVMMRSVAAAAMIGLFAAGVWTFSSRQKSSPEPVQSASLPVTTVTPALDLDSAPIGEAKVEPDSETRPASLPLPAPAVVPVPDSSGLLQARRTRIATGSGPSHHGPVRSAQQATRGAPSKDFGLGRTGDAPGAAYRQAGIAATVSHPPVSSAATPRSLAESQTNGGYIGTFTAGFGGIRTFQYVP